MSGEPRLRTGGHWDGGQWAVTLIAEGAGEPDADGRREGDRLVGVVAPDVAEEIVRRWNAQRPIDWSRR